MAAAAATAVDGDERVMAAAQQILMSLGTSDETMKKDMLFILKSLGTSSSSADDRFSSISTSSDPPPAPSDADIRLDAAANLILRWDSSPGSLPWDDSPDEASAYLSAVDDVISAVEDGSGGDRAESLLQQAMQRLEDELRHLLVRNTVPLDIDRLYGSIRRLSLSFASSTADDISTVDDFESSSIDDGRSTLDHRVSGSDDFSAVDLMLPGSVDDLQAIANRMIRAGYGMECLQAFASVRRGIIDECLQVLGIDRLSIEEVQRIEWRSLDERMKKWVRAVKVSVRVLLAGERRLCDLVFAEADSEACFVETAKGCVVQLLNFGEAIVVGRRSSEKLFRILDMYDALNDVLGDLQGLFPGETGDFLIEEAEKILEGLGDAARGTFAEFESAVKNETSRKPIQGGEIHPLSRYVMNYVKLLVDYSDSLNQLLEDQRLDGDNGGDGDENAQCTPLGRRLLSLISYLETNLDEKSKLYEDAAMGYIFLMNNVLYIVKKVKDSDLRTVLGDHWVRTRRGQVRQYATAYLRASWTKVLSYLKDEGIGSGGSSSSVSKVALKERFKSFNAGFEEVYRIQTAWKVPDEQLREELRISISEKVIPAYRSFLGRFGSHLEGGRHAGKYIKYTPDDLENHLSDLFEGSPGLMNHPRRKLSS
ncbi:hypothetical protein QJS10_CPA10g01580 [Acorus calamus]|uniref:Exocyst subunit Exo70 family protein n=1 Tax=Acorus calamus TaxID=4465 RepID=A0AAV9E5Y3_ACOCL|nr:hypothetical protein QJS10_CPA10g01580 [Acorus calamus]